MLARLAIVSIAVLLAVSVAAPTAARAESYPIADSERFCQSLVRALIIEERKAFDELITDNTPSQGAIPKKDVLRSVAPLYDAISAWAKDGRLKFVRWLQTKSLNNVILVHYYQLLMENKGQLFVSCRVQEWSGSVDFQNLATNADITKIFRDIE